MDLQNQKKKLNDLAVQLEAERRKSTEYNNRAGGFGDELNKAVRERDETYKTLDNDVNQKRNDFYNTSEQALPALLAEYGDDPALAFQNLGRERARRGTAYQNTMDIRNRKKQNITDFVAEIVRGAQLEAQKQKDNFENTGFAYQLAEGEYGRMWAEEQARKAEAQARAALAESQRQFNANYALQQQAKAEAAARAANDQKAMGYGLVDELVAKAESKALAMGYKPGSREFNTVKEQDLFRSFSEFTQNKGAKAKTYGVDPSIFSQYFAQNFGGQPLMG